ncbi:MAG TPA: PaaI family thioesterase [Hyphomicrobiaceae bacterium]|nr:PaaI family thioesterase [Hyphomicrobiaceae bacterium]
MDAEQVSELLRTHFPGFTADGSKVAIEAATPTHARVRMIPTPSTIRPGGTISGPAMFKLADLAVYVALLSELGVAGLDTATSSLNITFLARPEPRDMIADARILRRGRRLVVGEVEMVTEGKPDLVAHAVVTYVMPAGPA